MTISGSVMRTRLVPVMLLAVLGFSLTSCGSSKPSETPTPSTTVSATSDPSTEFEGAPRVNIPVDGEISGGSGVKVTDIEAQTTVMTGDESDQAHNPETWTKPDPNAKVPQGFTVPGIGVYQPDASKINGWNSFIAVTFEKNWKDAVAALRTSMEAGGWECYACMPYVALDPDEYMKTLKYSMDMELDGHKVFILIGTKPGGGSVASMSFQG